MGVAADPVRSPILFFNGTLAAAQTLFDAMGAAATPAIPLHGQQRLRGTIRSSVAPAAGFPRLRFTATGVATAAVFWLACALPAVAHPHVWVTVETTVLFEQGSISGFRHKWTFDEFYTSMAVQGLELFANLTPFRSSSTPKK